MQKPSVMFISRVFGRDRGNAGRLLEDLANGFATEGWKVTVITSHRTPSTARDKNIVVHRIRHSQKEGIFSDLFLAAKLSFSAVRQADVDLIVTVSDPMLLFMPLHFLSKCKKARHIHWCLEIPPNPLSGMDSRLTSLLRRVQIFCTSRYLRKSDRTVAIGRCMEVTLPRIGMEKSKIVYIPNWSEKMDMEQISEEVSSVSRAKYDAKPLRINNEPRFRVLYAGPIDSAHPVRTILDTAGILQILHPEIEFTFMGGGEGYEKLALERTRRRLENIKLLPLQPRSQLKDILQSGDIHLISLRQGLGGMTVPSALYAAFSAERPCIFVGPSQSEVAYTLAEFKAGSVCPQGDPKALADAILLYRMEGTKWFEAHKGALSANVEFSPERSIKRWISTANAVLGLR